MGYYINTENDYSPIFKLIFNLLLPLNIINVEEFYITASLQEALLK